MVKVIADVGSCWGYGNNTAAECVQLLSEIGISYVKFQLCKAVGGNMPLPMRFLKPLVSIGKGLGVSVSASVWGHDGYRCVKDSGATWIKFAHSAYGESELIKKAIMLHDFEEILITTPLMESGVVRRDAVKTLWTYEINGVPVYPVTCQVNHRWMYDKYDGFSSHCLDWWSCVDAVKAGAQIIEVHVNPLGIFGPPDSLFALTLEQTKRLVGEIELCTRC